MPDEMNRIEDEDTFSNYTAIPNIIDDMGLSAHAVRLYVHLKRRVKQLRSGETEGAAYDSTRALASACRMSAGTVSKSKKELKEAGLIKIKRVERGHGEFPYDHITIVNVWEANKIFYRMKKDASPTKPDFVIVDRQGNVMSEGEDARKWLTEYPEKKLGIISDFIKRQRNAGTGGED